MYTSNELIVLKNQATGETTRILPNTEFELPAGNYINLNEARLCVNGKTALVIRAGEIVENSKASGKKRGGTKPKALKKTEARQVLREEGKSFPVDKPAESLIELSDD